MDSPVKYIKAYWDGLRGDDFDHWGNAMYYFELDEELYPTRQIEIYDNGNSLKYSGGDFLEDIFGTLSDQTLPIYEMPYEPLTSEEFQKKWERSGLIDGKKQW